MRSLRLNRLVLAATALLCGWASATAQETSQPQRDPPRLSLDAGGHTATVWRLQFRPGSQELITIADDKTIRFWDVNSGEPLRVLRPPIGDGDRGKLYAMALSDDGDMLAVGGFTKLDGKGHVIYLISLFNGEIERVFTGHNNVIHDLAFSRDGKQLLSASADDTARLWNLATGEVQHILKGHASNVYGAVFSPDGSRCATASYDGTAAIWSTSNGERQMELKGHTAELRSIDWSPNGRWIATASYDKSIRVWDSNGKMLRTYDKLGDRSIGCVSFTDDSRRLLWVHSTGQGKRVAGVLDLSSGENQTEFDQHDNTIMAVVGSPDQKLAASTGGDNSDSYVWNIADGKLVQKLAGRGQVPWSMAWSEDGTQIAWGNTNRGTGVNTKAPLERTFDLTRLQFGDAPDESFTRARPQRGSMSLKSSGKTTVDVLRNGKKHVTLSFSFDQYQKYNTVHGFTLLPGDRAAIAADFGLHLFDTRSGKEIYEFIGHTGTVWGVSPSPDGRYLLTASNDMTLRIWDPDQRKPLLNLFFAGEEWVAWTPDGYYASSPGGEALIGWHLDNGPDKLGSFARASQFRDSLYQPEAIKLLPRTGSIARALEASGKGERDTNVAQVIPPTVYIARPDGNNVKTDNQELTVMVGAKQVGMHPITSVQLLLDGRPYGGRAGVKHFDTPQRDVRERFYVQLSPGVKHRLQVRADSAVSYGLSRAVNVTYQPKSNTRRLPALYVLAVGVKDYQDDDLDLNFADEDAKRLERAFRSYGKGLFREVQTKLMVNGQATQRGILTGLDWLKRQMSQGDIGVVYYSGHGDKDSSDVFHLMPHDVERDLLSVTGVSDAQIKTMVGAINGRVLMLLDACNSGAAAFKNPSSLSDDLVRDLVSDDFGITVMSSSTGKELSQESSDDRGGYFTIAFVEGLSGKADANQDGVIYSSELANYVADRVKTLTKGQQHPVMRNPAGVPAFPLAKTK